jgi:HD-GYP domain-containing protein (c-di-GMP phosphodiesterase class II)
MSFGNAILEIKKNKGIQWRADVVEAFLSSVGKTNA